jgi:tetratricopeptide (TPR) repeat protein
MYLSSTGWASDCGQGLNIQEKISRFKELDRQAESSMHSRHFHDAVQLYQQAVCLIPNTARAWYGLGMAQAGSGAFLDARVSFQTADRLQPSTPMPLIMQVRMNLALHDMDALKANLREMARRFPQDSQAHAALARILAEQNLLLLALAEALRSEHARNADPISTIQLAVLENASGIYQDAVDNALAIEEDHGLASEIRASAAGVAGLSYEGLGETDRAVQYLNEAIALHPSSENSYIALADLYEQLQRYEDAVNVLKRARLRFPDSVAVLLPLGVDLVRVDRYDEGTQVLREVLERVPNSDQAYLSLADAAHKQGNLGEEIKTLQALAIRRPDYPKIHILIARAMLNREPVDYDHVLTELSLAERKAPADPEVFFLEAKAFVALHRYRDAVLSLRQAIALRPTDPALHYQLARVYQRLGNTALAQEQFKLFRYLTNGAETRP